MGRLGTGFSVLKPEVPRIQTQQASFSKILALPPWLQDTITELDASHPLRAAFPAFRDPPDSGVAGCPPENFPGHPTPQRTHPNDVTWSFHLPSTSPRIPPSRPPQPDSDTSSEDPQPFSTHYPSYDNNSLLHLRSRSPTPSIDAPARLEGAFPPAADSCAIASAPIRVINTTHISEFKTTNLPSSSFSHNPSDPVSLAPGNNAECDGVFRYNMSQADSAIAVPPSQPFIFERPIRVHFDSPIEDPTNSDPLESDDHDPFKLDPEECKNLNFKWAPFDLRAGSGG